MRHSGSAQLARGRRFARPAFVVAVAACAVTMSGAPSTVRLSGAPVAHAAGTQCRLAPAPEHVRATRSADLGCPTEVASPIESVEQFFELGVMLWRSDTRTIYVLSSQGGTAFYATDRAPGFEQVKADQDDPAWRSFPDAFAEGQSEAAGLWPPDERLQEPVRGFGKVWREQLGGPSARLGWATTYERRVWSAVQSFERGLVIRTDTGRVYVLRSNGTWSSTRA